MTRQHVAIASKDRFERGRLRGQMLQPRLSAAIEGYLALYRAGGLDAGQVEELAGLSERHIAQWRKDYVEELDGVAAGAGVPRWQVIALNARTEILAHSSAMSPAECTVLVDERGSSGPRGVQTWDWQDEFGAFWHTQAVAGGAHSFAGITEHGILAKIGVNDAGVGVFLNILSSRGDGTAGVPVHVLLAAILEEASSVDEAVAIIRGAVVASSSAITILDRERVVTVELSPTGVAVRASGTEGYLVHTNHYLAEALARGENQGRFGDDSYERMELVLDRLRQGTRPAAAEGLVPFLQSGPGEPHLCCVPSPGSRFGLRWRTLATILIEPSTASVRILDGSPLDVDRQGWLDVIPPTTARSAPSRPMR